MSDEVNKPVVVELGIEFVVELLLFLGPYGAEQMGLPHNFWLGLGCWLVGAVIAIRMFWIFPAWAHRLTKLEKGLIAFILVALFVLSFYKPVVTAYGRRDAEEAKAKPTLVVPEDKPPNSPSPSPSNSPSVKPIPAAKPLKQRSYINTYPLPLGGSEAQPKQPPTMSQECAPGADCAMSTGQQGGMTVGKLIIGDPPPPPLKLTWTVDPYSDNGPNLYSKIITVSANVVLYPVSLAVICDQEVKKVEAFGAMFGERSGPAKENNRIGIVYYENPPLAAGVKLQFAVYSGNQFSVLDIKLAKLTEPKQP